MNMKGPYSLGQSLWRVGEGRRGVYMLCADGAIPANPRYVGRSDTDLKVELGGRKRCGDSITGHICGFFWYEYAGSPVAAYGRECELWHRYGGEEGKLENRYHPQRPKGRDCTCPRPGCRFGPPRIKPIKKMSTKI